MTKRNLAVISILMATIVMTGHAQTTNYISDQLEAPVRAGAGDNYRITKMLTSGQEVEVLNINKATNYAEIRYGNAKGWIHKRFLMDEPAARIYVQTAKDQFEPLQKQLEDYQTVVQQKDTEISHLQEENNRLKQALQAQADQLTYIEKASENVIKIDAENRDLQEKAAQQAFMLDSLEKQNKALQENKRHEEWMTGGGLIFFSMMFGALILPRLLRFRTRKKSWDNF